MFRLILNTLILSFIQLHVYLSLKNKISHSVKFLPMAQIVESLNEDLTIQSALKKVFETSRNHDSLKIGASEVVRSLYQNSPLQLVVISEDLLEDYKTIITKKAEEVNIPVVKVESRKELGEMMPFSARKMGAVGVVDFIHESREKAFIFSGSQ